ncbi:Methyltransferase domain-containing protein [Evansella caseinilytica]|uniref:Methyltransferase domain-containing protein n=1 Tax=Evansella caseinilytica TaxID=1503961 RepID=A0A1H3HRQ2_9BACI|nr:class I SAM-dependent methyltransferase [Evansella caseinilytica]SDY18112.1 Methyltransferase domain-containing protein [Evansella caseinilytica]
MEDGEQPHKRQAHDHQRKSLSHDTTEEEVTPHQVKALVRKIKLEAISLPAVMWAPGELTENKLKLKELNQTLNGIVNSISKTLYFYEKRHWKKILPDNKTLEEKEEQEQIADEKARLRQYVQKSSFYAASKKTVTENKLLEKLADFGAGDLRQARVLDIGCGDGYWLRKFIQQGTAPENTFGMEIQPQLLEQARQQSAEPASYFSTFPDELPFAADSFDIILMFGFLTHILNDRLRFRIGREATRVLKKDGLLLTTDLLGGAEQQLEPFFACTLRGVCLEDLNDIFPECEIAFEENVSRSSLTVIRKKQ